MGLNRASAKRKRVGGGGNQESGESDTEEATTSSGAAGTAQSKKSKKVVVAGARELKLQKAKYLVGKAAKLSSAKQIALAKQQRLVSDDRRATWNATEDELILLIKCTHMYFLPNERSVPSKLITDVFNRVITPNAGLEKKVN